jgi:tetratricopeptide (TPR) repeat protein
LAQRGARRVCPFRQRGNSSHFFRHRNPPGRNCCAPSHTDRRLAYARASILNSGIAGDDRARKAKARAQAEEALRLSPTLGEAHLALGLCLYWGEKKYDAALKEFERAAAASPNNAEIVTYVGGIYRRQGRWPEAVTSFARALSLDPRNARIAFRSAINHIFIRDWPAAADGYKRALELAPDDLDTKVGLAYLEVVQNNNPAAGRKILQSIPPAINPDDEPMSARWDLAMLERDYDSAERILADYRGGKLVEGPKTFYQGRTALARGDAESAQRYFAAATPVTEQQVRDDPDDPNHHADLGLLYAYMHRKEDALPGSSARGRTRARKPGRISWGYLGGQPHVSLCTRGRTGPGDHADRASPFHSRSGPIAGSAAEHHARRAASALGMGFAPEQSAFPENPRRTGAENYSRRQPLTEHR